MTEEPQTSVSDHVGERMASGGCSDFHIRHMASVGLRYPQDMCGFKVIKQPLFGIPDS